ncbi:hypothetical protein [Roseovarius salinarum]|uniref:hypothetical protein n=1 Tax=Roseovarius salinarum TaxID=1981892 RepID=UPI000C34C079|nr:hypothetical protein [Roseovarius salinarum]
MLKTFAKHTRKTSETGIASPGQDSIQTLIGLYYDTEKRCDEATDELERKAKEIIARVDGHAADGRFGPASDGARRSGTTPASDIDETNVFMEVSDKEAFSYRAQLARKYCIPYRVMSGTNFIEGVTDEDLETLENLEIRIQLLQYQLQQTEHFILDSVPEDTDNALAKLKFISALLLDGCHLDTDHFAYHVKECVDQCEGQMRDMLDTYRKHEDLLV